MKEIPSISDTLDEFLEDLNKGIYFTICDERLLKRDYFEIEALVNRKWKRSRKCSYPNCIKKSIKRAHTIPKSLALKKIAENNFVFTPNFAYKNGRMEMLRVGIGEASTFPGLCEEHEQLYISFENRGYFEHESEVNLQIFRSILRERFRLESDIYYLEKSLKGKNELLKQELRLRIAKKHGKKISKEMTRIWFEFPYKHYTDKVIKDYRKSLNQLNKIFYEGFEDKVVSQIVQIDIDIPVCLSGMSTHDHNNDEFIVIFNVIPNSKGTLIGVSYQKGAPFLEKQFEFLKGHPVTTIKFIENLMVKNTDHWFIKPSVWQTINSTYQRKILDDISAHRIDLIDEDYSIFNNLKHNLLLELGKGNENPRTIKNVERELNLIRRFSKNN